MVYRSSVCIAISGLCLWADVSPAQSSDPPPDPVLEQAIRSLVEPYVELGMFGGTILLAQGNDVRYHAGVGPAEAAFGVPNRTNTRFRIASISKPFTAIAIGTLYEAGLLTPETTLDAFVPDLHDAESITIDHLLDHRSGVAHINELPWYEREMKFDITLDELVRRITEEPLDFPPGEEYNYSNGGYALLASVIERISGQPYGEYLRDHVLAPLGLEDTAHELYGSLVPRLASGYQPGTRIGSLAPATYVAPSIKVGGGSLYSTAADLFRFSQALFRDNVVRAETYESLFGSGPVYYFSGRAPGFNTVLMHNRAAGTTAVVVSNNYAVTANSLAPALLATIAGQPAEPPSYPVADDPAATRWAGFTGTFRWPAPFNSTFTLGPGEAGSWRYHETASRTTTAAVPLADGSMLLALYDARCSPADDAVALTCTAPWASEPLALERVDADDRVR